MLAIIEKVKDLFKCKSEKQEEFAPQQEEPRLRRSEEEQPSPSSEEPDFGQ
jgi:hypothetical protein